MIFKKIKNLFKRDEDDFNKIHSLLSTYNNLYTPIDFKNFDRKVKITKIFKLNNDQLFTKVQLCNYGHKSNQIKKTFIIPVGKPKRKNIFKNFIKGLMMK